MGKRSGVKKKRRDPYVLSSGRLEDEEEDEEETLSSMLHQFKGKVELDKMRSLKRKLETVSDDDDDGDDDNNDDDDELIEDEADDEDNDGKDADGIDMGTRACWGRHKARYYVGGKEKDYESEELAAAIREAEKFDPPRVSNGLQWLSNFYSAFSKHTGGDGDADSDDDGSLWSLHSSDLEWFEDTGEKKSERKTNDNVVASNSNIEPAESEEDDDEDDEFTRTVDKDSESEIEKMQEAVRRPITREMEANRGIVPRRKKDNKNPRVKHRNKFRKALIKHHSQVPKVRREDNKYGGEINGIRCGLVRSRKFH